MPLRARTRGGLVFALLLWGAGTSHLFASEEAAPAAGAVQAPDRVVVRVNGEAIMASELARALAARVPVLTGHGALSPERIAVHRKAALQELVVQRLVLQEARKEALTVSPAEIDQAVADLRARFPDAASYARATAAQGLDPDAIRAGLEAHLLGRKMEGRVRGRVAPPTREQLAAYHAAHPEKFRLPPRARVVYLLAPVDPAAPKDTWETARARVGALAERVRAGAPFDVVAAEAAKAPDLKVVDLGPVHQGQAEEAEIDKAAFALEEGGVSDPVWTLYGYAVVHATQRQAGRQLAFDELNLALFEREWLKARRDEAMQTWVAGLMEHAELTFGD